MKIVVISECKAREIPVLDKILQFQPNAMVIQPTFSKKKKKKGLTAISQKLFSKIRYSSIKKRLAKTSHKVPEILNRIPFEAIALNSEEGINFIKRLSPELLITCRAPLLCKEITDIPSIAAINIHYGIAPEYRGNDTLFWAMYHQDHSHIGGTIHHINKGVDTGNILAKVYPALSPDDNETSIDIKTSSLLANTLLDYLYKVARAKQLIPGKPQSGKGKNYRFADRTISKSLHLVFNQITGKYRLPSQAEKTETFFEEESISLFA